MRGIAMLVAALLIAASTFFVTGCDKDNNNGGVGLPPETEPGEFSVTWDPEMNIDEHDRIWVVLHGDQYSLDETRVIELDESRVVDFGETPSDRITCSIVRATKYGDDEDYAYVDIDTYINAPAGAWNMYYGGTGYSGRSTRCEAVFPRGVYNHLTFYSTRLYPSWESLDELGQLESIRFRVIGSREYVGETLTTVGYLWDGTIPEPAYYGFVEHAPREGHLSQPVAIQLYRQPSSHSISSNRDELSLTIIGERDDTQGLYIIGGNKYSSSSLCWLADAFPVDRYTVSASSIDSGYMIFLTRSETLPMQLEVPSTNLIYTCDPATGDFYAVMYNGVSDLYTGRWIFSGENQHYEWNVYCDGSAGRIERPEMPAEILQELEHLIDLMEPSSIGVWERESVTDYSSYIRTRFIDRTFEYDVFNEDRLFEYTESLDGSMPDALDPIPDLKLPAPEATSN